MAAKTQLPLCVPLLKQQELTEDPLSASLSRHQGSWAPNRVLGGFFPSSSDQKPFEAMSSSLGGWHCQKQDPGQGSFHHHRSQIPTLSSWASLVRVGLAPLYLCLCHCPHLLWTLVAPCDSHSGRPLCPSSWHNSICGSISGSPSSQIHKRSRAPNRPPSHPQSNGLTLHRNNVAQTGTILYSGVAGNVHWAVPVLWNLMHL